MDLFGALANNAQDASNGVMSKPSPAVCSMSTAASGRHSPVKKEGEASGPLRSSMAASVAPDEPQASMGAALELLDNFAAPSDVRPHTREQVRVYMRVIRIRLQRARAPLLPSRTLHLLGESCIASERQRLLLLSSWPKLPTDILAEDSIMFAFPRLSSGHKMLH
jgi:hypothetical protein